MLPSFSLKTLLRHVGGNASLVFAMSLVGIVSVVGGSIDVFNASTARKDLQDALDSAVLAGVRASASQSTIASKTFIVNADVEYQAATQSYSSSASSSSTSSGTVSTVTYSGTASSVTPTYVMKLIGINDITVRARATAQMTTTTPNVSKPCIYVLDPSGSQALLVNSGAKVTAPNCEIHVKSTANPAAIFNSGSSLNFKKLCLKGTNVIQNSTTVANLSLGCAAADDPYAGTLPTPSSSTCTYSNLNYSAAAQTMSPGVYCGWFNFNNSSAVVTFQPGVYVIKSGGWNVNGGTWKGAGVTFYFEDTSKIQFNSGISADLTAPTSGTYANLLFYEKAGLSKTQFIFNDSVSNRLQGLIWLPSREIVFNAKSGVVSDNLTMVSWRLILNNTTWLLDPLSGSGGGTASTKVRLVR